MVLALGGQDGQALGMVAMDIFVGETADAHPEAAFLYVSICNAVLGRTGLLSRG